MSDRVVGKRNVMSTAATPPRLETYWDDDPLELLRVHPGFRLADLDTGATPGFATAKRDSAAALAAGAKILSTLQTQFFANSLFGDRRKILLVLQGMDTAGKGGVVRHVVSAVDPQGIRHVAFKAPTKEERAHDFLWRIRPHLPAPGLIGVFDRSHYEDVLIARVQKLAPFAEIEARYDAINRFEQQLVDDDTTVIKVMMQISLAEQKARLSERLERPEKQWKYSTADVDDRLRAPHYQDAYQVVFERTATEAAPWYVIPADKKWYARLAVQHLLIDALARMDLSWPAATFNVAAEKARLAAS